jgi:hypothetical protein
MSPPIKHQVIPNTRATAPRATAHDKEIHAAATAAKARHLRAVACVLFGCVGARESAVRARMMLMRVLVIEPVAHGARRESAHERERARESERERRSPWSTCESGRRARRTHANAADMPFMHARTQARHKQAAAEAEEMRKLNELMRSTHESMTRAQVEKEQEKMARRQRLQERGRV